MTLGRRPLPQELRETVYERDQWKCVAPLLGAPDPCRDLFGTTILWGEFPTRSPDKRLTLDHVKDQPMLGKRAPDDEEHLVTLCWWHHLESGWATAHRPELREYLRRLYP